MRAWPNWIFYAVTFLVVGLDQLSKLWAITALDSIGRWVLLPHFFELVYVQNTGVAFGLLAGHGAWVALLVALLIVGAVFSTRNFDWNRLEPNVVGALLCGGAIGNLVDRVRLGYVVDFIHVHAWSYDWPVFNLADSLICVAVGWIVARQLFWR